MHQLSIYQSKEKKGKPWICENRPTNIYIGTYINNNNNILKDYFNILKETGPFIF